MRIFLILLISLGFTPLALTEDFSVTKLEDSCLDAEALVIKGGFGPCINGLSFQQDALVSHKGRQYVGYYDAQRQVCLARRALPNGAWEILRFTDYHFRSDDAHNTISIGICPKDGSIHLAFDHHGHDLHYRCSSPGLASEPADQPWTTDCFGEITKELERGKAIRITYPRFWQTPEGGLQFCYRRGGSGNGDRMLVDYDPSNASWRKTRQIDSGKGAFTDDLGLSKSRCSYPNSYSYGPQGRLHTTWVWREDSQGANHDLVYLYSEDQGHTWKNNVGNPLTKPAQVDSPGVTAVEIPQNLGLMNTHGQAVDSHGRIHVVMWHCTHASLKAAGSEAGAERWGPAEARAYHHYWRDKNGRWRHNELPGQVGTRPKIFIDKDDNAFVIINEARSHGALSRAGNLLIYAATPENGWKDWRIIHTETGPFLNEMVGDPYRWKESGVLSVLIQESPSKERQPTPLRILDFKLARREEQ